jgi:adenylate cyclase
VVRLSKRRKRFIAGIFAVITCVLILCLIAHFHLLQGIHLKSSDFLYNAAGIGTPADLDNKIVIVAIDDRSLEELGRFSTWPRTYHARLLDTLAGAGARVIAFDILFSEPSADDDALATSIQQAGNVVLPLVSASGVQAPAAAGEAIGSEKFIRPLMPFEESALAVGHANIVPDEDGIVRRLPLLIPDGENYEPALSLTTVAKYLRRPQVIESPPQDNSLPLAGRSIPVDDASKMLINYASGPAPSESFTTVSYLDVLQNNFDADVFKDKIVFVGITAIGFGDLFCAPTGHLISGVELHANATHTILAGNFLRPAPNPVTYLLILILAACCGLAVLRLRSLWSVLVTGSLVIIYFLTAFYYFDRGIIMDMLYPPLTIASVFVVVNLYNATSARLEKREITRTFGRYVSPSVATKILEAQDAGSLKLGGEECLATILFADIRNFTSFSEQMNPQELVSILNRYMSVVIETALRHDGMVNKFTGDGVMVVWNAPIDCPEHALFAAKAAVEAQKSIMELQKKMPDLPRIEFGIGVNTGNVVAGNMGSTDRLEYSVIGDAVNTAARLASVAPGGRVWISAATFELITGAVKARPLEPLTLKGKRQPIQAYEIEAIDDQSSENQGDKIRKSFEGEV